MSFSPAKLVARCYVRKIEGQWVGVCLDFDLATQADTEAEAKDNLIKQVCSYVVEAMHDTDHTKELLTRRAPLQEWMRYWSYYAIAKFQHAKSHAFRQNLPLAPIV